MFAAAPRLWRAAAAVVVCLTLVLAGAGVAPISAVECSFLNPIIPLGQDPSVVYQDGSYYLVQSVGGSLAISRSETLTGLRGAASVQVYRPPTGEPYSYDMWAPELQYIDGSWYIYVAATDQPGNNPSHRMFVLQADTDDPLGSWMMVGKVYDPASDKWAIDGAVFEYQNQLYMVWSGWEGDSGDFPQNLYIAEMSDPLTISGERHLIGQPDQPWESSVAAINEGPQPFIHDGRVSIVYSADASWMPAYKLGILTLTGDDPLEAASWTETGPVFEQVPDAETPVYGPGHNSSPVRSPDGQQHWFLYHAKTLATPGWDDRAIYAQSFTWSDDGVPVFEPPIPPDTAQPLPSGEPCGLVAALEEVSAPDGYLDLGQPLVATVGSYTVTAEVRLNAADGQYAFVSQDGGITSNFVLGYQDGRFAFTLFDGLGRTSIAAESTFAPEVGTWYALAGVYDAPNRELSLYVDGELHSTAAFADPWDALGSAIIGAARRRSQRVDIFDGDIRAVGIYIGSLNAAEVVALAGE